jgi:hypothetical protein
MVFPFMLWHCYENRKQVDSVGGGRDDTHVCIRPNVFPDFVSCVHRPVGRRSAMDFTLLLLASYVCSVILSKLDYLP